MSPSKPFRSSVQFLNRMWQLTINGPGYFDTTYDLPEGTTHLGRADDNDIVLSGDLVSRRHARITVRGDHMTVEDLGSRNGSQLNGDNLSGVQAAKAGDLLQVGENSLALRQPSTTESAKTDTIDLGAGGAVRRYGRGSDIGGTVILAKDVGASTVRNLLDNIAPFEPPPVPFSSEDEEKHSAGAHNPIAFNSLLLLYRVAEHLATATGLQPFLENVTDWLMEHIGATTAVVLTRHPSGVMVPAAVRHYGALSEGEVPVSDAIIDAAITKGQALAVANVREDQRFSSRDSVVLYGVEQVLCIPIGRREPYDGVLYLNRSGMENLVEDVLELCKVVAQLIETGLQRWKGTSSHNKNTDRLRFELERFMTPHTAERRLSDLKMRGSRPTDLDERVVTLLVADLSGFTQLMTRVDPKRTLDILNGFYETFSRLMFSFDGSVGAFSGDGAMALFGAPYSRGDDAMRAVRAALKLRLDWNQFLSRRAGRERCEIKVGLNTGRVLAGCAGGDTRLEYTALGEPVNVAHWLCQYASSGQILVTTKTLAAMGARFDVNPLGEQTLPGSRSRIPIFEVVDEGVGTGSS